MNAYNFNLPVTDRLSLIGMTVEKDGKIYVAYDRTNSSISNMGSTYQQILKNAGYPSEAIEAVEKKFEDEVNKTHKDNPQYLKEYLGAINYIKSLQ
jgi:hypothetical protein